MGHVDSLNASRNPALGHAQAQCDQRQDNLAPWSAPGLWTTCPPMEPDRFAKPAALKQKWRTKPSETRGKPRRPVPRGVRRR